MVRALDEMPKDLDDCFVSYNAKRPHYERNIKGMPPYAAFKKGLPKSPKKEPRKAAANTA